VGSEEYYDYIFPDEQAAAPNLKLLERAHLWKKQRAVRPTGARKAGILTGAPQQQQQQQEEGAAGPADDSVGAAPVDES
jgi:hypothetical protein